MQPLMKWESNKYHIFRVCVYSLRCAACNAHAPYCHLWPAPLYNSFPRYLINGTVFEKKLLKIRGVFRVSIQFSSEIFPVLGKTERGMFINVCRSSGKVPVILVRF